LIKLEGRNPVLEALRAGLLERMVLEAGHESDPKVQMLLKLARSKGVAVETVDRRELRRLSQTGIPQGVVGFARPPRFPSLEEVLSGPGREVCILILDQVQDPRNLGAIIRTAEGAGVDGVLLPRKGSAEVNETVHRVSMGASLHVPVWRTRIYPAVKRLRDSGVRLVAVDPGGGRPYYEADLGGSVALVFGGENRGVSPTLLEKCGEVVRIPMRGHLQSLNVSVAAGVVLYERLRQMETS